MSRFDIIFRMDWLTTSHVVIECDRHQVTLYSEDGVVVRFVSDWDTHRGLLGVAHGSLIVYWQAYLLWTR